MAEFDDLFADDNFGLGDGLDPLGGDPAGSDLGFEGLPDLAEFGLNNVASQDLFGGTDEFDLSTFGAPPATTQPAEFPSFPQSGSGDATLFEEAPPTAFDVTRTMSQEERQAAADQLVRAEGFAGIKEEAWDEQLSASGKNGLNRAIGTVTGGAVGGSVATAVLGTAAFTGVLAIPAAIAGLAFVAAGAWGGRQVADSATDYDEKAKEYATAKTRFSSGIYEEDNLGQYDKDQAIINTWENTQEIERMQDKSFVAGTAGFGAEMLPYVAEFAAGFSGKARTIGALITDPKRAASLMNAAKAMKAAGVPGVKSIDDGVAKLLGKIGGDAAERIPYARIPEIAKSMAASMGDDVTEEIATAFLKNYKPSKLMGNPLLSQLLTGGIHGVASIPGNEMLALDQAAFEGTESSGFGKAAARHVTEIMSEYLGAAIFDPVTQKPVKALLSKIKGSEKLTPLFKRMSTALNTISERLQFQAGLPEYWEESAKELMDSMLNINNAGTPQSVRVMESLTSFVPHNAEQLDLLAKLQVLPLASAAVFSATGGRTDSQQSEYRQNLEKVLPFYTEAQDGPAITDRPTFDAHAKGLFELLTSSEAGDRRLLFQNSFGDKVPPFLRYVPGSVTSVFNKETSERGDVKDIETWGAQIKEMEDAEEGSGYQQVSDVLEQLNRSAMQRAGLGEFIIARNDVEVDTLKRLVNEGILESRTGGFVDRSSETDTVLTSLEKDLVRSYGVTEGKDALEAFNKAKTNFETLDPDTQELSPEDTPTPDNLHTKLFDHVSKQGNIKRDKGFRENLGDVTKEIGALSQAFGAGNMKIHLASTLAPTTVKGYTGKKGLVVRAFNHVDEAGVAHLYISPGATVLDIYEDMHELVLKKSGIVPKGGSSRAVLSAIAPGLRAVADTLQTRQNSKELLGKQHDKKVLSTINLLLSHLRQSSPDIKEEDRLEEAVIFEDIAKLINLVSVSKSMSTSHKTRSLTNDEYLTSSARNQGLWTLVSAMEKETQVYAPLQEVLGKVIKRLDLAHYSDGGILKSGLSSFVGGTPTDSSKNAKEGLGAIQEKINEKFKAEPPKAEAKTPVKEAKTPVKEAKQAPVSKESKPTPKKPVKEMSVKDLLKGASVVPEGFEDEAPKKAEPKKVEPKVEAKPTEGNPELAAFFAKTNADREIDLDSDALDILTGGAIEPGDLTASAAETPAAKTSTADRYKKASDRLLRTDPLRWAHRRGTGTVYKSFLRMTDELRHKEDPYMLLADDLLSVWNNMAFYMHPDPSKSVTVDALVQRAKEGFRITLGIPETVNLDTAQPEDIIEYVETKYLRSTSNNHMITFENGDTVTEEPAVDNGAGFGNDRVDHAISDALGLVDEAESAPDAAGEAAEYRALRNISDVVSAMNMGGALNRLVVWEVLKGNVRAKAATLNDDAYFQYLYNPHPSEKEASLAELLAEHAIEREVFHSLVQLMDSIIVPGVDEFVFQSSEEGTTASHVQTLAPRRREAMMETLKHNLLQVTSTIPMTKHFAASYLKTRDAAIAMKTAEEKKRQTPNSIINLGTQKIREIGRWADPIYEYTGRLLNMDAQELRRIDQDYLDKQWKEDGKVLDPPTLRMFKHDLGNVLVSLYGKGRGSSKVAPLITSVLVGDKRGVNPQFFEGPNAQINLKLFRQKLASELKLEGHVQDKLKIADSGAIGALNVENIVRGLSAVQNPLMFRKRTGGLQNNMLMDSHMFRVANEKGWTGLSQYAAAGRSRDGIMRNSNLGLEAFASIEAFHEQDISEMLRAEFDIAKEGETYKAWVGPMGDKKQIWRIDRVKLSRDAAIAEIKRIAGEITSNNTEAKKLALFIPAIKEIIAAEANGAYMANHALVTLQTSIDMYGEDFFNDFKNSIDIVKRRGSAVSTGIGILSEFWEDRIAASDAAAGLKRQDNSKMNAIVIEDPKLIPQLMETLVRMAETDPSPAAQELATYALDKIENGEDIADGFALVIDRSMDVLEEGYGKTVTRTGEGSPTPRLNILKTIISNQTDILKQSAGRLSPEFAKQDTGVISMVYDLIQKHEANGGEALDMVFFSSGAKRDTGEGTTVPLFKSMEETGGHKIEFNDDVAADKAFTFKSKQFRRIPIQDVRWQLNAQSANKPHDDRVPRQLMPVYSEFASVFKAMLDATIGNLAAQETTLRENGVPLTELVNSRFSSLLQNVADGKTGLDPITRYDSETMIAKAIQKRSQFKTPLHHAVEWPIGQETGRLREYQAKTQNADGTWSDADPDAVGSKMALAHAELNMQGVRRNSDQMKKPITFDSMDKAIAYIRNPNRWHKYLDMFEDPANVKTEVDARTAPIRGWELMENSKGEWAIPGEPVMILRVPADNVYSVSLVRVAGPVVTGVAEEHGSGAFPNVIRTPLSIQIATGSDFDIDKRFIMPLRKTDKGDVSSNDRWNAVMMSAMVEYSNSSNFLRIAAPLDVEPINRLVATFGKRSTARQQEINADKSASLYDRELARLLSNFVDPKKLRLGHPTEAQRMYNSNQIGKKGLGFVASLSYGLNIMNEEGLRLANVGEYDGALVEFSFEDPLTGETRSVVAGRNDGTPSENYTTTTKKIFGMFLNLFADHGKLQKIDKLGITDKNVPMAMAMLYAHGGFASEQEAIDYLGNVVAPAMLTPEVQEWIKIQDVQNRVGATEAEVEAVNNQDKKIFEWNKNIREKTGRDPTKGFQSLFRTTESLQSVNRLLRAQFTDISDIADYERTHNDLDRLADSGQYGAWVVSDTKNAEGDVVMPRSFEPTQKIFNILEDNVFDQSVRTAPVWKDMFRVLFAKRKRGKEPSKFVPTKERIQLAYRLLNQAVAVRSMSDSWDTPEGTSTFGSVRDYVNTQMTALLEDSDAVAGNEFLSKVQLTQEKVPAMEPRTLTDAAGKPSGISWFPGFKSKKLLVKGEVRPGPALSQPYLSVLSLLTNATFNEAEIAETKAGFEKLPTKLKQALVLYALMRHGLSAKSFRGSYLQFVSDAYLAEIHEDIVDTSGPLLNDEWDQNDMYDVLNFIEPKLRTYGGDAALSANAMVFDPGFIESKAYWKAQKAANEASLTEDIEEAANTLKGDERLPAAATRVDEAQVVKLGERKQYTKQPDGSWKAMNGKVVKDQKIIDAIVAAGGAAPTEAPTETAKQLEKRQKKEGQKDFGFTASAREVEAESAIRGMKFAHFLSKDQRRAYDEASSIPRSPMEALNQAIHTVSKGVAWKRAELMKETKAIRETLKAMVTGWQGDIKGLESAVDNLLAPLYADFSPVKPLVSRYFDNIDRLPELRRTRRDFKEAAAAAKAFAKKDGFSPADRPIYQIEEDYLKGLLDGTIEPYKTDPEDQQNYRDRMTEELGEAGSDFNAILDGKPAPNLRDSAAHLSASAHEWEGVGKLIGELDNRTMSAKVQENLKKAVRAASAGSFIAGITAQRIRRHVGAAKKRGHLVTKENEGDRVLQAVSVLLESGIDLTQSLEQIMKEVRASNLTVFTGVELLSEEERKLASEDQRFKLTGLTSVAQLIEEYETFRKGKKLSSVVDIVGEVNTFFEGARKSANETVGEEWIPEFRLGGAVYLPHLYDYTSSSSDAETIQSEESARVLARSDDTLSYHDAALRKGLVPRTLDVTELIEGWDATVGGIQKNRILFRGLANMTDVFGNPVIVPARPRKDAEGQVEGTIISEEQGEKILHNLIESSKLYFDKNDGQFDWVRDGTDSTWQAINSFLDHFTEKADYGEHLMTALGYTKVQTGEAFGLRKQAFWVVKGPATQAVKHMVEPNFATRSKGDDNPVLYKAASAILKVNRFVKTVNVGFSLFHHFALTESWLADTGWTPKSFLRASQNIMGSKKLWNSIIDNPELAAEWVGDGLNIDAVPMDVDLDMISNGVDFVADKFDAGGLSWMGTRLREMNNVKRSFDNFLWHKMLPVMKLQMANEGLKAAKASGKFEGLATGVPVTEAEKIAEARMREDIAKYVNDALGSQEWVQYLWATPQARDILNTFMFAPDWTISALNVSGVPEIAGNLAGAKWLGYTPNTEYGTWRRLNRYWPGFYTWIFLAIPSVMQAAITAAYGDDDDKFLPWQNEKGRRSSTDITPLIRHAAIQAGVEPPTRRSYAQPGKQMREIGHWLHDPVSTIFGKSSAAVRVPITATTGVIKPSLRSEEIWSARNDADKWGKIAGNLMPFAATSLSRTEVVGGPVGFVLSMSMPRVGGLSGVAAKNEISKAVTSFANDEDVRGLAPAVAKKVLADRVEDVHDRFMRQGATDEQWKGVLSLGLGESRGKINKDIREEWKKGPGKADGDKIQKLLIAANMLYGTNKKARQALETGIRNSISKGEQSRSAPQKMAELKAKLRGANGGRKESLEAGRQVAQSRASVFRVSTEKLKRRTN